MNHPPPSDRTHATGVPPLYLTLTEVGDMRPTPKYAKQTQSPPHPRPKYAEQTQFPTANIHSTIYNIQSLGPIYPQPPNLRPKYAKQTQFAPKATRPTTKKHETNPIPTGFGSPQAPKTRNEPNLSPPTPPIYNLQSTIDNIQSPGPIPRTAAILPVLSFPRKRESTNYEPNMRNEPKVEGGRKYSGDFASCYCRIMRIMTMWWILKTCGRQYSIG